MASVQAKTWITWNQRQNISPSKLRQNYQNDIIYAFYTNVEILKLNFKHRGAIQIQSNSCPSVSAILL